MYTALRAIEKAVFVGGSNASNLAYSASALGLDAYKIAKGGWKLSKENVDKLLPISTIRTSSCQFLVIWPSSKFSSGKRCRRLSWLTALSWFAGVATATRRWHRPSARDGRRTRFIRTSICTRKRHSILWRRWPIASRRPQAAGQLRTGCGLGVRATTAAAPAQLWEAEGAAAAAAEVAAAAASPATAATTAVEARSPSAPTVAGDAQVERP